MTRSLKQRLALSRRPQSLAIGTVRLWQDGLRYIKVSRTAWRRLKEPAKGQAQPSWFASLTAALAAAGDSDPAVAALAGHVAEALKRLEARQAAGKLGPPPVPLAEAVRAVYAEPGPDMAWRLYCARRWAHFNGGMVDLEALPGYVAKAKAMHHGKHPPEASYGRA